MSVKFKKKRKELIKGLVGVKGKVLVRKHRRTVVKDASHLIRGPCHELIDILNFINII